MKSPAGPSENKAPDAPNGAPPQTPQNRVRAEFCQAAIIRKNLDGIVVGWDCRAERLFGYRAEEIIGRPVLLIIPPDRQEEEMTVLERLRRGEQVDQYRTVRKNRTGQRIPVTLTLSPLLNAVEVVEIVRTSL